MASHIYHPGISEGGLHVGCDRCAEIANRPTVHLDAEHLNAYWQKMLDLNVDIRGVAGLTDLDLFATSYLYRVYVDLERLRTARVI